MHIVTRLTEFFTPHHYDLSLDLHRLERTFEGTVTVQGEAIADTRVVKLHSKDLIIETVLVDGQLATFDRGENDELSITSEALTPGDHTVVIRFSGTISDAMHGLYPCYYEHAGVKKELLATQFESHHAREVFPCIDEPAAKATFNVTLTTEDDVTVLGNMPVNYQDSDGQRMVTKFETSPRMSTYLLAFVVGELQRKTAHTKDGVEVNVYATPAQPAASLDYPLDIAVRSIEFYNDYFATAYPLPKSDHVALPDFSSGAMENWGLITYREIALLADPESTSISSRQYIATVIAHELAHQWFGNLVTMQWWNDLWLNESFATIMEYVAVDTLHPEWNMWLDFNTNESVMALRRDSLDGVQSVQVDVNHPDEISTLFDGAIVYAKGARLLRMIQTYIGSDAFQAGLKAYFQEHAYKNTIGNDLWEALENSSGKPVTSIMNQWISQPGYPVVSVSRDNGSVTLTQEQFFVGPHEPSQRQWPIPLQAGQSGLPELMDEKTITVESDSDIRLNQGDTSHFITSYDESLFASLVEHIRAQTLDSVTRAQLLNEATLLARGGRKATATLVSLIDAYKDETSEPVWGIVAMAIAELKKFVEDDSEAEAALRKLAANISQAQYERLGWTSHDGESEDDTKLRSTIIGLTLYGENTDAINTARSLYDSHELHQLDPELRPVILSSVVRHGDESIVDELLAAYKTTQFGELRQDICVGITSTRIQAKIAELLEAIKDSNVVRPQDVARWFVYLVRGRDSKTLAWEWIRDNWEWVEKTFSGDKSYDDYPRYAAGALTSQTELQEYKAFFEPLAHIPALSRAISIGISEIEGRVELIERDKDGVQQALLAIK
jgi:aminopeptidase N